MRQAKSRQVYDALNEMLRSGKYAPGARLPSMRQLAERLTVSTMAVTQAAKMLEDEGAIVRSSRAGLFVADHRKQYELTGVITSISPASGAAYYAQFVAGCSRAKVIPMIVGNRIEDIESMLEKKPSRLFLDFSNADMPYREICRTTRNFETVFCHRFEWTDCAPESAVITDWRYITLETLRRFLSHGHKRILFVSHDTVIHEHKRRDFLFAASELGIEFETPQFQWCCARDFEVNPERVRRIFRKDAPTAIFSRGDFPLYRFMQKIRLFFPGSAHAEIIGAYDTEWANIPQQEFASWHWDWEKFWDMVLHHQGGIEYYRPQLSIKEK